MYIEIMFADKNNHFIKQILKKKRKGGDVPSNLEKPVVKTLPFTESKKEAEPTTPMILLPQNEFPDTNYLYKNMTSNKNMSKANICAFYSQDNNFFKFIVESQDAHAVFPSFVLQASQSGGFLDDETATSDLDKQFQQDAINFVMSFFKREQDGGEPNPNVSMSVDNDEEPKASPVQEDSGTSKIDDQDPTGQLDEDVTNQAVANQDVANQDVANEDPLNEDVANQDPSNEDVTNQDPSNEDVANEDVANEDVANEDPLNEDVANEDVANEDVANEDLLDEVVPIPFHDSNLFLQEEIVYDNLEYIGYIMFNDEPFVFINIGSTKPLNTNYKEALLNDLFYTFKVFDADVDQTIRDLFDNNRWLLNEDQPYSGYMCTLNEANQLVNVKIDEDNADLINVDSIGDYYYFSFLPIVEENIATQYKRFAFFPNEYVCILDDTQMEEYKENKLSYAEDKSIYFKGETLRDKKTTHEFMCVKTPSQFTQY
jgi:hypothetical protein